MSFYKLLLSFSPWLAFLFIARDTLFRLEVGLVVGLVLTVVMGIARLQRGVIFWVSLLFFVYSTAAVVLFNDMWTVQHMGILGNGALAVATWLTIVFRRPFTLAYAREHTDPARWNNPVFIRTNYVITSVWSLVFTFTTMLAWAQTKHPFLSELGYQLVTYTALIGAMAFTSWYPKYVRRRLQLPEAALSRQQPR
jgi:hypothetical protein